MKPSREYPLAIALLLTVLIANAAGLWPELTITRVDLNDNVFHFPLIEGMVHAIEQGQNSVDWWAPEWCFGYPVLRTYQPLAHAIVALAYFALGKTVSLMTVFIWVRYLSVALLPLTFFVTARLLTFPSLTAAAAAMLSPLISTNGLYGIEYGSYLWAGSGLFTQAVACHFLLLTIGFAYRAIRRGRWLPLTGVLLGLTFLSHYIYGYIGAVTVCLLAFIPDPEEARSVRLRRTVWVGAIAFSLTAFQLLPLLLDPSIINHSRWEYAWKWNSFGARQVLKWLFTGALLDYGRLPVLSLLALSGAVIYFVDLRLHRRTSPARTFVILGAMLWIVLFFGRSFWGRALFLLGVSPDMQLHRVIGGAQIFLVLLAALGLAALWRYANLRWRLAGAALATLLLFYPMVRERAKYLANNDTWGRHSLAIYKANKAPIDDALARIKQRGGRAYAGLAASWGASFKIGDPAFYAYMSEAQVPAVSFMYHSMSLTSEIMTRFNEWNPDHYRLFNIRSVLAPVRGAPRLPDFLEPVAGIGPFQLLGAPGNGFFELVDSLYAVPTTRNNFYDVNDRWLQSDWVGKRQHLWLDFHGDAPSQTVRLSPDGELPPVRALSAPGAIDDERQDGQVYQAEVVASRQSFVLFKMTWHPNWKAFVDGKPVHTAMLSPGFIGAPVTPGRHHILFRYEPGRWRTILAISGVLIVILIAAGFRVL